MKVAEQLHKTWGDVNYDDLAKVQLPEDDIIALKAILGTPHPMDISELGMFLEDSRPAYGIDKYQTYKFNSTEELLIQEMIEQEAPITDKQLKYMSELYGITYIELKTALPKAMKMLHDRLIENL